MTDFDDSPAPLDGAPAAPAMDWYIVHTYSGFEDRVVQELTNRIKADIYGQTALRAAAE